MRRAPLTLNTDMNESKHSVSVNAFVYALTLGDFVWKHTCRKKRVDTSSFLVDIKISGARFQNSVLHLCGLHAADALGGL